MTGHNPDILTCLANRLYKSLRDQLHDEHGPAPGVNCLCLTTHQRGVRTDKDGAHDSDCSIKLGVAQGCRFG